MRWLVRLLFISACALLYYAYYIYFQYVYTNSPFPAYIAPLIGIAGGVGVMFLDLLYRHKIARNFLAVFVGLLLGVLFSELIIMFLERFLLLYSDKQAGKFSEGLKKSVIIPLIPVIYLFVCYMSVTVLLHAKESMRLIIPFVSLRDESRPSGGLMLDSSALIDGRIVDLCSSRIIDSNITIPRFVVSELQTIADSPNKLKRLRGRRGLDIIKKLQSLKEVDVEIIDADIAIGDPVDERLVRLCVKRNARVVTNDFNLHKVAQIHGVEVVNINDIANAMKLSVAVGETIEVEIVKAGEGQGQGIGHLPDGTLVVVDNGSSHIGKHITVIVTNIYIKDAGRIVFAKPVEA